MLLLIQSFWLWELIGKLHPLMVHFPIGLLVTAGLFELLTTKSRFQGLREGIYWMLILGAASAVLATIMGLILHNVESYGGDLIENHEKSGIATTILALITCLFAHRFHFQKRAYALLWQRIFLVITILTLTIAGHLGASLTHGDDYLSSAFPSSESTHSSTDHAGKLAVYQAKAQVKLSENDLNQLNLDVRAIFAHNCYQCHSEEKSKGGLILQNEEMAMTGGDSGPVIIPGKASESEIIRRLKLPRNHDDAMPPKGKILPEAEIDLIEFWINQGAHWADEDLKIFREAPLALEKPKIPSVSSPSQDPIDLLVSDYFEKQNQSWPEVVSDGVFIRRAYLDAIGLLPSPEEISRFTADANPQKREILIDSLLNAPDDYAQHWLSFWNDLLRNDYTGTGFITGGREQISNWLYQSLTDNKPYDQMVRELLNPEAESRGFIKGIQWRGVVNASQRTEMQAAQNISQSLLGLNLKCASCHDSFISNLTLEQAYGFANVFADSALEIHRCDKPTGKMAETAFLYPELGTIEAAEVKNRLAELANAVVQPENGRLYRTIVNRLWARLFGRGIVAPVDEMDRLPWSQELLDWLAADFIEHGYDLKRTIGIIMKSQAYQLPSVGYENVLEINSENFQFHGPIRKRLSAEQFADALSQVVIPVYPAVTFNPLDKEIPAQWIWDDEIEVDRRVLPKPGERFFRHSFSLEKNKQMESAEILISADHQFTLFLNEEKIGEGSGWRNVYRFQVNENLKPGENLFAIKGVNDGDIPNPAGILLSLQIIDNQGDTTLVLSDRSWVSAQSAPDDWIRFSFDDSEWKSVRSFGRPLRSPWGQLLAFKHDYNDSVVPFGRASMVKLDPFQKALGRPTRENVTTSRDDRATLLQALELTNGDFFNEMIQLGAEKWKREYGEKPEAFIEELYMKALGRKANQKEKKIALNLLGENPGQEEVEDIIWSVLMLPEFQVY